MLNSDGFGISLSFCEAVENGVNMQIIGKKSKEGFAKKDLINFATNFKGCETKLYKLHKEIKSHEDLPSAYIVVIKKGLQYILKKKDKKLQKNLLKLKWDKKKFMYGRVVNSHARWNLCFANFNQKPDYKNKRGRVYDIKKIKLLRKVQKKINKYTGEKLFAEGNLYFDFNRTKNGGGTAIKMHCDKERRKIVAVRFGKFPLFFQWYIGTEAISKVFKIKMDHGDIYMLDSRALGENIKTKPMLKHSAGGPNYKPGKPYHD